MFVLSGDVKGLVDTVGDWRWRTEPSRRSTRGDSRKGARTMDRGQVREPKVGWAECPVGRGAVKTSTRVQGPG